MNSATSPSALPARPMRTLTLAIAPVWLSNTLLAAVIIVPAFDFRQNPSASFSFDLQLLARLAICAACGLYGLMYLGATRRFLFKFPGAWALLFCAWATCTIPLAKAPSYTGAACFVLWCVTLFVPAVIIQLGARRLLFAIVGSVLASIVLAWSLYFFVPSIGRSAYLVDGEIQYRVGGDAQQLGLLGMWLIAMVLVMAKRREVGPWFVSLSIAIGLGTILFSQSRTSMVSALAICGVAFVAMANRRQLLTGAICGIVAIAAACWLYGAGMIQLHGDEVLSSISRTRTQQEIFNITGRTEFWPYVIQQIGESPVWGHGFGGARQALYGFNGGSYSYGELHHPHNAMLNVVLTTGLVGGILFTAMVLSLLDNLLRKRSLFTSLVLVAIVLCGLTESILFGPMPRSHTILWIMALYWVQSQPQAEEPLLQRSSIATQTSRTAEWTLS